MILLKTGDFSLPRLTRFGISSERPATSDLEDLQHATAHPSEETNGAYKIFPLKSARWLLEAMQKMN